LHATWWHIAEVAASQHFINASNGSKNTQIFIPRGKAAILAICSLHAVVSIHFFFHFMPFFACLF
jgi:hypothetical protein